jgi:ribosomal protein S18 acetylase RimI-like enzyme
VVHIRAATKDDLPAVDALVRATAPGSSPLAPHEYPDSFVANAAPGELLVASIDDQVVGFVRLARPTPLTTNAHVLTIAGMGVAPERRHGGIGRSLVSAAVREAKDRGARRLTLRVLGNNRAARDLYSSLGFVVEGVLHEEFQLDGQYVDDLLMALPLA